MRFESLLCIFSLASLANEGLALERRQLADADKPRKGWTASHGAEFPGAVVDLGIDEDEGAAWRLEGDFSGGGNYVSANFAIPQDERMLPETLSFGIKHPGASLVTVRLIDGSGQCHQLRLRLDAGTDWQEVSFNIRSFFAEKDRSPEAAKVAGYENWGGGKSGTWDGTLNSVVILLGRPQLGSRPKGSLWFRQVEVAGKAPTTIPGPHRFDFETADALPAAWRAEGRVVIDTREGFGGGRSLFLERDLDHLNDPTIVVFENVPVVEGIWQASFAFRSDLHSPDDSYNVSVTLETLDAAGKVLERHGIGAVTGVTAWKEAERALEIRGAAASARFVATMNKTYGKLHLDNLELAYAAELSKTVFSAVKIGPRSLGGFFYPEEIVVFDLAVECLGDWPADRRKATVRVTDFWGADQTQPLVVDLPESDPLNEGTIHRGVIDFGGAVFQQGKYHEVHVSVANGEDDLLREYSAFTIQPRAVTKNYRPHEVPFTINNWDDRVRETFFLADRIGIRWKFIWSGAAPEPPYTPHAPGIELIKELDMGAVLRLPGVQAVERNRPEAAKWTPEAIRGASKAMVEKYKDYVPIMMRCGNEPHGGPEQVARNIVAYKAAYEGVKEADPDVFFIGPSCNPNEEYFLQGFQPYQHAYDFHMYEGWKDIRRIIARYRALFEKYGHEKPIFATEIGLNSQGMCRLAVARDMVKKFSVFFAEGGANFAWFNLLYPDPQGRSTGSSGAAHDVFRSKYSLYCPKITAVTYYNMVNGICVKKFVEERQYDDDSYAMLFRDADNRCLVSLWRERGRMDVFFPMPGVGKVRMTRIDGSHVELDAASQGLLLTFSENPLLLEFESATMALPETLAEPVAALKGDETPRVVMGGEGTLRFAVDGLGHGDVELIVPPLWTCKPLPTEAGTLAFAVGVPEGTLAREGMLALRLKNAGGEIEVPVAVDGKISAAILPEPWSGARAGARITIRNNSSTEETVDYAFTIDRAIPMARGRFGGSQVFVPREAEGFEGRLTLPPKGETVVVATTSNLNPKDIYLSRVRLEGSSGGSVEVSRRLSGFVGVPRVTVPLALDVIADQDAWDKAPPLLIDEERQYYSLSSPPKETWTGPEDLSAVVRFLWDDRFLYLRADVTDDKYVTPLSDGGIWNQDGLQLLVDPARDSAIKGGYYDISLAGGTKGPQVWCNSSADPGVATGAAGDVVLKVYSTDAPDRGDRVYVAAIPWQRLAPFDAKPGANLGMALIVNEDDGGGRSSFMAWFGCAHAKLLDHVGDLVLLGE